MAGLCLPELLNFCSVPSKPNRTPLTLTRVSILSRLAFQRLESIRVSFAQLFMDFFAYQIPASIC